MMKYYYNLYISEPLLAKKHEILEKLRQGKLQVNRYLIVLAKNQKNHLEFFDSAFLKQKQTDKDELFVVGIADGCDGALELVEKITQEVYDKTRGTDIRNYLLEQQREFEERVKQV